MNNMLIGPEEKSRCIESLNKIQEYCEKISFYNLRNMSNNKIIQYYTKEIFKEIRSMKFELNDTEKNISVSIKKSSFIEKIRRIFNV